MIGEKTLIITKQKKNNNKKYLLIPVAAVLLISVAVVYFIVKHTYLRKTEELGRINQFSNSSVIKTLLGSPRKGAF